MRPFNRLMKRLKATVIYTVPHWSFCNSDDLTHAGELTGVRCQFCEKSKEGHRCMLYDQPLSTRGPMIEKLKICCAATAGKTAEIIADKVAPPAPTVPPKDLMKHTLDTYIKTLNDLLTQGYPKQLAETIARKYVLGEK